MSMDASLEKRQKSVHLSTAKHVGDHLRIVKHLLSVSLLVKSFQNAVFEL